MPEPQPVPGIPVLTEVLAALGRPVTVESGAPAGPARAHLARTLVAVTEACALRAEHALGDPPSGSHADLALFEHQGTYDAAAAPQALERLGALCYWRAQRLSAGVEALRTAMSGHDPISADGSPSPLALVWDLAGPATAAAEGIVGVLARLTMTEDAESAVAQLEAATALLVLTGERAARLRAETGLDAGPVPVT